MSGKCNFELLQVSVTSEISEWAVGIQRLEGSTEKFCRWNSNSICYPPIPTFLFYFFTSTSLSEISQMPEYFGYFPSS